MPSEVTQLYTALECVDEGLDSDFKASRAINVAVSGLVFVNMVNLGTNVSIFVAAGIAFPVAVTRIHTTGTTAQGIKILR